MVAMSRVATNESTWDHLAEAVGGIIKEIPKHKRPKLIRIDSYLKVKDNITDIDVHVNAIRWPGLVAPVHVGSFVAGAFLAFLICL